MIEGTWLPCTRTDSPSRTQAPVCLACWLAVHVHMSLLCGVCWVGGEGEGGGGVEGGCVHMESA